MSFEQLECGSHWPLYQPATVALAQSGEQACAVHNNCSGKHCGFLSFAHHQGINPKGYTHHQHPVQLAVNDAMGRMMDLKIDDHPMGIDGCSIPTYALPLPNLAMAFARFGTGEQLPDDWQHACHSLYQAMVNEPFYVAGSKRHCTKVMQAYGGQVACKTGAEGVFGAAIPSLGLGIALKALDGNSRAAEVALNALLDHLHIKPTETHFERHLALYNCNEIHVSDVQLASDTL
jgi:L-asparaginase II